jgi:branched-chain amino acid transport system substrate-binding protein
MNSTLRYSLIAFTILSTFLSCKKDNQDPPATQEIPVAALFSLTGNWSDLGIASKAATEIAVEEINADFISRGLPYRFKLNIFDTKLDPAIALSSLNSVVAGRGRLVVGPQSSSEVAAIRQLADSIGMLVVSQGSTASTLSIANDAIFRYCPGDQIEGAAMANTIYNSGKRALITVARDDAGNLGLQTSTGGNFQSLGGAVVSAGSYAVNETDFTAILSSIRNQLLSWATLYTPSQTAVYLASFDEAIQLFHQAAGDSVLAGVSWYGGDGFIKDAQILVDTTAAGFAFRTSFFSPEFGLPASSQPVWQYLVDQIVQRSGVSPDAFALSAYDVLKVMAKTVVANAGIPSSPTTLQSSFFDQSNQYVGATGVLILNAAGDRANGSFDYWGLAQRNDGTYYWTKVGQSQ